MNIRSKKAGILVLAVLALTITFFVVFFRFGSSANKGNGEGLSAFKTEVFQEKGAWAYRILEKGTPVIEQRAVPGIAGSLGFKTEKDARKIADLVKSKLDRGLFPPTVTRHELDSLQVAY